MSPQWVNVCKQAFFHRAQDNIKYLTTLERLSDPLYKADPAQILAAMPALINAIRMTHSISRYFFAGL